MNVEMPTFFEVVEAVQTFTLAQLQDLDAIVSAELAERRAEYVENGAEV